MTDHLAVFQSDPETLSRAFGTAALAVAGQDPRTEMFVRIRPDHVDTPANAVDTPLASYCTFESTLFEEFTVSESTAALLPVGPVLEWLEFFDDTEVVTVTVVGEAGAEYADTIRFEGQRQTAAVSCVDPTTVLDAVEITLPDRFADGQFLDDDHDPVPTTAETTAGELERLVDAADRCQGDAYPLALGDGLGFEVSGDRATASGTLAGTVEGPPVAHRFGSGFARVVRAVEGSLTLQTGPDQPLAICCTDPGVTYRYVLTAD